MTTCPTDSNDIAVLEEFAPRKNKCERSFAFAHGIYARGYVVSLSVLRTACGSDNLVNLGQALSRIVRWIRVVGCPNLDVRGCHDTPMAAVRLLPETLRPQEMSALALQYRTSACAAADQHPETVSTGGRKSRDCVR